MKRILSLVALMVFAAPSFADDKAKIKELEDRLSKVEAAISWKTTEPKVTHKAEGPFTLGSKPFTVELKAVCNDCQPCTCGDNCKCVTPSGVPKQYTFGGVPHTFINGSYHPNGKVSTAPPLSVVPPLTTSSPAPLMSSGVRVVTSGTGYPVHSGPQYHGSPVHFTHFGPTTGSTCANGRCGR